MYDARHPTTNFFSLNQNIRPSGGERQESVGKEV